MGLLDERMGPLDEIANRVSRVLASVPRPTLGSKNWLMVFRESNLLFASWRADVNQLRPLVPSALELDTYDGSAWLTVEALQASMVRFRNLPANPLPLTSAQVNVRTYVQFRGERGIHFLSLDCPGIVATTLGKILFHLPFRAATPKVTVEGDNYHAESVRVEQDENPAHFAASGKIEGAPALAQSGTADDFLLNQSNLFTVDANGDVYRGRMGHRPRAVQTMKGVVEINTLVSKLGVKLARDANFLHFCPGDDALAWPIVKVPKTRRMAS